ncbi:MAG TPA: winged helix-turn-helix domain-containing protein [Conexibacter sp.]|nr:winged helix-turn-helix domain-containing protein [Conexibacter sp.]
MTELLLPRLKREIDARIEELRPLVAEAAQLEAARDALLEEIAAPRRRPDTVPSRILPRPATSMAPVSEAPARPRAAEDDDGASRSPIRDAILALVEERPGVSVAEIASVTKIAKPTVATTVSKLKRDGVLADEMGGVKLASRKPITLAEAAAAVVRDGGVSDEEWEGAAPQPKRTREGAVA